MLNPYTSTLVAAGTVSDGISLEDDYDFSTRGRRGIVMFHNVTAIGNGHSYVDGADLSTDGINLTAPLIVAAGVNDTFSFNSDDYVIAPATYSTLATLAAAIAAAAKSGPAAFSVVVTVSVVGNHLRFVSVPTGVHAEVFAVGSSHDVLAAATGLTNGWTIAHTEAAGADGAYSATITLQGKDEESGSFYDILSGAAQSTVSDKVLQIHPFMAAVANLTATSQLTDHIRIKVARTTTNVITRSLAYQLTA